MYQVPFFRRESTVGIDLSSETAPFRFMTFQEGIFRKFESHSIAQECTKDSSAEGKVEAGEQICCTARGGLISGRPVW